MPKVKTALTELEERRRIVRACISSKQELNGWTDRQMSAKCRFSKETLRRRREAPETFTLEELWGMGIVVYLYDGQTVLPDKDGAVMIGGKN